VRGREILALLSKRGGKKMEGTCSILAAKGEGKGREKKKERGESYSSRRLITRLGPKREKGGGKDIG